MLKTIKPLIVLAGMSLANLGISAGISGADIDAQGRTALMWAAQAGDIDKAHRLLTGLNNPMKRLNSWDNRGRTALMYAAIGRPGAKVSDTLAMVNFLITRGADTTTKDNDGHDAMYYFLLSNPDFKLIDMKDDILQHLGRRSGESGMGQGCWGSCDTNIVCTESEAFSLGGQRVFRCTKRVQRTTCRDSCLRPPADWVQEETPLD